MLGFIDGALSAEQDAYVEAHLDVCPECRRALSHATRALASGEPSARAETAVDLIGRRLGNFAVIDLLGAGAMGSVYLGQHAMLGHQVAIKVMEDVGWSEAERQRARRRFVTEARALCELDCERVVRLHDFGELDDGRLYFVMERLRGDDLGVHLMRASLPLTPEQALPYIEQIAEGLQAAHDLGIVHRDLKPANIFVMEGAPLKLKLLDFGLAKRFAAAASITAGGALGSPLYAAPELLAGRRARVGPEADLFSFGVIIYQLLSGELPYEIPPDAGLAELLLLPTQRAPIALAQRNPAVPAPLAALVGRCLSVASAQRPRSAAEVASTARQIVDGWEGGGRSTQRVVQRSRQQRLRWLVLVTVALAGMVGSAVLGAYAWRSGELTARRASPSVRPVGEQPAPAGAASPTVSSPTVSSPTVSSPTVSSPTVSSPTVSSPTRTKAVSAKRSRPRRRRTPLRAATRLTRQPSRLSAKNKQGNEDGLLDWEP